MCMSDRPEPGSVRPPAAAVDAAAQTLLALVEEQLPTRFNAMYPRPDPTA
jgi:hypothetical protein